MTTVNTISKVISSRINLRLRSAAATLEVAGAVLGLGLKGGGGGRSDRLQFLVAKIWKVIGLWMRKRG